MRSGANFCPSIDSQQSTELKILVPITKTINPMFTSRFYEGNSLLRDKSSDLNVIECNHGQSFG